MDITTYIKETMAEMKHVSWPSRKEVAVFTMAVISVSIATALSLGFFDFIFSRSLGLLLVDRPVSRTSVEDTRPDTAAGDVFNPQILPSEGSSDTAPASSPIDFSPNAP